jgi:hypothetical protein
MCSLGYDFGTCGECQYTTEQLVEDYPNGTSDAQATAQLITAGDQYFIIVIPHRTTCSQYKQSAQYDPKILLKGKQ